MGYRSYLCLSCSSLATVKISFAASASIMISLESSCMDFALCSFAFRISSFCTSSLVFMVCTSFVLIGIISLHWLCDRTGYFSGFLKKFFEILLDQILFFPAKILKNLVLQRFANLTVTFKKCVDKGTHPVIFCNRTKGTHPTPTDRTRRKQQ